MRQRPRPGAGRRSAAARRIRQMLRRHRGRIVAAVAVLAVAVSAALGYYYVSFARLIDQRLAGERDRVIPRVYARPLELRSGQWLDTADLVARLNAIGYTERPQAAEPGDFTVGAGALTLRPRGGSAQGALVSLTITHPEGTADRRPPARLARITVDGRPAAGVVLDPPLLSGLTTGSRERRRRVALEAIPERVQQAVLAIEDRRFFVHPGIDPIRIAGAAVTNLTGRRSYLVGASTITQQLARSFFLAEAVAAEQQTGQRSWRRKILEQIMALILEVKTTKQEILELYLNDVYLGHRGSFAVHGVAEAARVFFGKDLANVTLPEAALMAGIIQSPHNHSPFTSLDRARERRQIVLRAMAETGFITPEAAALATAEPVTVVTRAADSEAPYFVDVVAQELAAAFPGVTGRPASLDVHTTLDLNLQRAAEDAVRDGLVRVDEALARRRRPPTGRAQAALVAVHPRTGEVLAMVGGRSYAQSQFNRATMARRQPGSTFKPFVYLAAFEAAAEQGDHDLTPATLVQDEPSTWSVNGEIWTPRNFDDEYDGEITLRRALALSRNVPAIRLAERVGFGRVAALWRRVGIGQTPPRAYPSIALGVFELTPFEVATAYTLFARGGSTAALRTLRHLVSGGETLSAETRSGPPVARPTTTYLVTNLMRGVLADGTGAAARAQGLTADAAGKSGTTNDLRDAWFAGFTPDLLAVVWVGFDDNQPLGLSGSQAALPIWTMFMTRALSGRPSPPFEPPEGISLVEIDRDTGKLASPYCPRVIQEAFLAGTEPVERCPLHSW